MSAKPGRKTLGQEMERLAATVAKAGLVARELAILAKRTRFERLPGAYLEQQRSILGRAAREVGAAAQEAAKAGDDTMCRFDAAETALKESWGILNSVRELVDAELLKEVQDRRGKNFAAAKVT